jgi:hypothetical protein
MSASEAAWAGPDIHGNTFDAHPVQHCADRLEALRLKRIDETHRRIARNTRHTTRFA